MLAQFRQVRKRDLGRIVSNVTVQTPGKPLLLTAFGYYLGSGILQDPDLTDEMSFRALRRLGTEQAKGFAAIGQAADRLGLEFRSALDEATAEVLVRLEGLVEQVGDTHRLTLDIEAVIAGLGSGQGAALLENMRKDKHFLAFQRDFEAFQAELKPFQLFAFL
jgi:hypothetical protein